MRGRAALGVLYIALFLITLQQPGAAQTQTPRAFYAVPVIAQQTVSSAGAFDGEVVLFSTKLQFEWHQENFPVGTVVSGVILKCTPARGLGRNGVIEIALSGIQLPNGDVFPIKGTVVVRGNGDHGKGRIGIPVGREAVLVAGTEIVGVLDVATTKSSASQ